MVQSCSGKGISLGPCPKGFYVEVSVEYSSAFPGVPLRVVSTAGLAPGKRGSLVSASGPQQPWVTDWFCCFFGPGAETQLRHRCPLQGLMPKEVVVQDLALCQIPGVLHPGDPLSAAGLLSLLSSCLSTCYIPTLPRSSRLLALNF